MDDVFQRFLRKSGPVLCLDIGSGTQDALLARAGAAVENWPRFVLPTPALGGPAHQGADAAQARRVALRRQHGRGLHAGRQGLHCLGQERLHDPVRLQGHQQQPAGRQRDGCPVQRGLPRGLPRS